MDRDSCLGVLAIILVVAVLVGLVVGLENNQIERKCEALAQIDSDIKFEVKTDFGLNSCMAGIPYHDKYLWFSVDDFQKANSYSDHP